MGQLADMTIDTRMLEVTRTQFQAISSGQLLFDIDRYIRLESFGLAELAIEELEARQDQWNQGIRELLQRNSELLPMIDKLNVKIEANYGKWLDSGLTASQECYRASNARKLYNQLFPLTTEYDNNSESLANIRNLFDLLHEARISLSLKTADRVYAVEITFNDTSCPFVQQYLSMADVRRVYAAQTRRNTVKVWSYSPLVPGQQEYLADSATNYCSFRTSRINLAKVGN